MFVIILHKIRFILIVICFALYSGDVHSHSVDYSIIESGLLVKAETDGAPVIDCGVKVFSPGNSSEEFQVSRTDINGNFVFYPDAAGEWRVELGNGQSFNRIVSTGPGGRGVGIKVSYVDGNDFSYSEAIVYSPGSKDIFQFGNTDKNGRIMFLPDRQGEWKVRVDDGMGHGVVASVVMGGGLEVLNKRTAGNIPLLLKIIIGVIIIGGLSYFYYLKLKRKK